MKNGFTLVELSIVLVIIGLLIGGILVGQSLIQSAEIQQEVRRLQQYAIAIEQFKQKFNQEAGDSDLFPNPGNNDEDNSDVVGTCPEQSRERSAAWSHLSQSRMLTEEYTYPEPGVNCSGWVNDNGSGYIGVTPTTLTTANSQTNPLDYMQNKEGFFFTEKFKRSINTRYDPEILWGLENKFDDGIPSRTSGSIFSETDTDGQLCTQQGIINEIGAGGPEFAYCVVQVYFNHSL